jgi:hypothetical protein
MVLWNVVGQAARYGVKGLAAFSQTEAGKRLDGAISPPGVVELDSVQLLKSARVFAGLIAASDNEASRNEFVRLVEQRCKKAERVLKRWANGSSIISNAEALRAFMDLTPTHLDLLTSELMGGSSQFATPILIEKASAIISKGPHALALFSALGNDPELALEIIEATMTQNEPLAAIRFRTLAERVFPFQLQK